MRVGILTNTYPPNLNGVSIAVSGLEKNLIDLGVEVFIATPQIKDVTYPKHILPLRSATVPDNISPDLKVPYLYLKDVKRFFEKNKVDIIHTHDTILGGAEGALLGYQLNLPTVHTFHTLIEEYNYFQIPGYKTLISNFVKEVCNQYDHVIAPSEKVYRYLLEKGVAVPISQILNIPNYSDLTGKITKKEKQILLNKFQIKETDTVLITFCRLAEEKGLELGINLLEPILKKNSNLKYILAGWGPFAEKLQEIVAQKNLSNQILFYGKYTRKELPLLASISNLFIFTSLTENLPTNIWEAMYLGLPVVSLDDTSVDYLLVDGKNGIKTSLEKFSQKCSDLISNPTQIQKMSVLAKKSAEEINPTEIASFHLDLYTKIVEISKQNNLNKQKNNFKIYFNEFLKTSLKSSRQLYEKLLENLN